MADSEYYKIILNKLVHAPGLSCDPETLEEIVGHQPATGVLIGVLTRVLN